MICKNKVESFHLKNARKITLALHFETHEMRNFEGRDIKANRGQKVMNKAGQLGSH